MSLPLRQIHLDFHTSEAIAGVGSRWDPKHFQEMLQLGRVNSINIFAKCHHGWCYYDTEVEGSFRHPSLSFDLLTEMLQAAHEIGVKTPVYVSVGLDEQTARRRPEWLRVGPQGNVMWVNWLEAGYHELCLRTPYLDLVVAQAREVAHKFAPDGLWLDIVGVRDCCCATCRAELRRRGQDPRDEAARLALGRETFLNYTRTINAALQAECPGVPIFHNSGHITRGDRELGEVSTHFDLESLPTGGWGYDHFPLSARYVQQFGRGVISMTGKFHTTWGEFGGYKHPNALRYESALALANGAAVSVGDQMHPYARLDQATYRLIGAAYQEVEAKEEWCTNVEAVTEVGVLSVEAFNYGRPPVPTVALPSDTGAVRVMQQGGFLYDILDRDSDFERYRVLVLPDSIPVDEALAARLKAFVAAGGGIFASGSSLLNETGDAFMIPVGARPRGRTQYVPEYLAPTFELANWDPAAFAVYGNMVDLEQEDGEVLAWRQDPFFNRDLLHFCSHQHAPSTLENAAPAMVQRGRVVYLALEAFARYAELGQVPLRDIIIHGVHCLLNDLLLQTGLPSQGVQTVMRQGNRLVVHLLYGAPVHRGERMEVIEDLVPLHDVALRLRCPRRPRQVYLAPAREELPFTWNDGVLEAIVPRVKCHQMVVLEDAV